MELKVLHGARPEESKGQKRFPFVAIYSDNQTVFIKSIDPFYNIAYVLILSETELKTMTRIITSAGAAPFGVFMGYFFQSLFNRLDSGKAFIPTQYQKLDPVSIYRAGRHIYAGLWATMIAGVYRKPCFIGISEAISAPYRKTPYELPAFYLAVLSASSCETAVGYAKYVKQMHGELLADLKALEGNTLRARPQAMPFNSMVLRSVGLRFFGFIMGSNLCILGGNQLWRTIGKEHVDVNKPLVQYGFMVLSNTVFAPILVTLNSISNASAKNALLKCPEPSINITMLAKATVRAMKLQTAIARILWKGIENGTVSSAVFMAISLIERVLKKEPHSVNYVLPSSAQVKNLAPTVAPKVSDTLRNPYRIFGIKVTPRIGENGMLKAPGLSLL